MIKNGQHDPTLPLVPWQSDESNSFAIFKLEDKRNQKPADGHNPGVPHRIGFHAIFLVTNGSFDHWMDFETHRLKKNQLVYIAPNQIHHFIHSKRPKNAWVLIFRPELLPRELLGTITNQQPSWSIVSYLWPSLTQLKQDDSELLEAQLSLVNKLVADHSSDQSGAAKHHVCGFIASAFEMATKNSTELSSWQTNERFYQFVKLAEENFHVRRDVKWYSKKLQCSDRTLNRDCMQTAGISAKIFLTQRVVVEAKRVLTYGSEPVSLVAESLGFAETTNFVRFFKKEVGSTPQSFRSLNQNNST